jgi:molybdopterin-guanine dinucleotide biosynthesis protein A
MTTDGVSGIVLAGGASSRFGSDKLAAAYRDRPLLELAVGAVAAVASEVLVVVAPDDDRPLPRAAVPVRRVRDPERHGGPLVGLFAGLEAASEPIVVVAGGDMPSLAPDVLRLLVGALTDGAGSGDDGAVLVSRGIAQPLPAALRNGAATHAASRLIGDGERSLRSLLGALRVRRLTEEEWRSLDPGAATLYDVDLPSDLPDPAAQPRT